MPIDQYRGEAYRVQIRIGLQSVHLDEFDADAALLVRARAVVAMRRRCQLFKSRAEHAAPRRLSRRAPPPRPPRNLDDELGDGAWARPHIPVRVRRRAGLPFRPPPSLRTRVVIVFPLPWILRVNDPVERGGGLFTRSQDINEHTLELILVRFGVSLIF